MRSAISLPCASVVPEQCEQFQMERRHPYNTSVCPPREHGAHTGRLSNVKNASRGYLYLKYTVAIIKIPGGFPDFEAEASLKAFMWGSCQ